MTYGEAYTKVKLSLHMVDGEFVSIKIPAHDEQMCKEDAAKYYTNKIRKEFVRLVYEYKKREECVVEVQEVSMKDFDSVDDYYDYYDYFEAMRFRDSLMVA